MERRWFVRSTPVRADNHICGQAEASDDFPIPEQKTGFYCVDVSDVEPGLWNVDINVKEGRLRSLILQVRDSIAPGDLCEDVRYRRVLAPSILHAVLDVPGGDWVNACGIEYAENINGTDYRWEDTGTRHPLAFMVWAEGSKDLLIEFWVNIPQLDQ